MAHTDFYQLISIAHRLQTVAYYDRILVMDNGEVAEVGHGFGCKSKRTANLA